MAALTINAVDEFFIVARSDENVRFEEMPSGEIKEIAKLGSKSHVLI